MKRLDQISDDFKRALHSLERAVSEAKTELELDGVIQRFEFMFELFWKLLKVYLEPQGVLVRTPREAFKEAYRLGLVDDERSALQMLDDRNTSVHIYDEATSREIAERIRKQYVTLFARAREKMNV